MDYIKALVFVGMCAGLIGCSATKTEAPATPATPERGFDAALAVQLGADEYGMKSYIHVVLHTGPADSEITDEAERSALFAGHFANMGKWADAGQLVLAGPFSDEGGTMRGLYIFNVPTVEDAMALVETDPTVEAGIFTAEYTPYYGSAALMQVNDIHTRIQETEM